MTIAPQDFLKMYRLLFSPQENKIKSSAEATKAMTDLNCSSYLLPVQPTDSVADISE